MPEDVGTRMFEVDRAASKLNLLVRAIGEVDDFRGHLGRDAENVCCPRTFGNNRPTVAPRERARGLIDVGAERSTEIRIHFRNVVKAAADAADGMVLDEGREGHIDGAPAGDVEKIFRHESPARLEPPNAVKYLFFHSLHDTLPSSRFRNTIPLFLNEISSKNSRPVFNHPMLDKVYIP